MRAFIAMHFGQLMQSLARRYSCMYPRAVNYMLLSLWLLAVAVLRGACGGRVGRGMDGIGGAVALERRSSLRLRLRLRLRLHMLQRHPWLRVRMQYVCAIMCN